MPEMRFYHLTRGKPDDALAQILEKAYERGMTSFVLCDDKATVKRLDNYLWAYRADSFLPHGTQDDGATREDNPILLGYDPDKAEGGDFLVLFGHDAPENINDYGLVAALFDGNDEQTTITARERWKKYNTKSDWELTYWQQDANGSWRKKE